MKLTAESTVVNDGKLNTNIDNAQTSANNAQTTANTATTKADNAQGTANTAVTKADNAQSTANTAVTKADNAQTTANQAKQVADNTAQYFWFTSSGSDTGAHISEKTQAQFVSNPSGGNLLARSNGIAVRDGLTELATFGATSATIGNSSNGNVLVDTDSVDIRDGSTVLATFGTNTRIGLQTSRHIEIKDGGMQVYQDSTRVMGHFGYGLGTAENGTAIAPYFSLGIRADNSTVGNYSVAEGYETTASGYVSHAESFRTVASGYGSHAEGYNTTASERGAHAEGGYTTASGENSHAEGSSTTASGNRSHAGGIGTIASGNEQVAIGRYNVADTTNLLIIGNGADGSRHNAFSVSAGGNVFVNGTQVHSSDRRLKEHIAYLDDEAIDFIDSLKPAHYIKDGDRHVGFYAQDVEEADKWGCMVGEMNGYKTLGYMELIAPLVAYVQKLEKRIEELERNKK